MRLLAAGLLASALAGMATAAPLRLHVPSPDWRDQVIYFVMTDRFDDGDPRNNDQGQGEHRPGHEAYWQGGDLRGLTRRLDYIRGLGATAVWITPPVRNRAFAPNHNFSGYHGYWPVHFGQVDPHLGTLVDYQRLSHELHRRGMYLVQDIVVNHTSDYFYYAGGWDAADPARFYTQNPDRDGRSAPLQWPFSLNDPRRAADRAVAAYHWTPDITDYRDPVQLSRYQMGGLDDLNSESPLVRRVLRASHAHWIRSVGVDAFRVDTAFYVPRDFYVDFLRARDPRAPGVLRAAQATGRRDFHVFGEGFGIDKPGETTQMRRIDSYLRDAQGRPVLPGMLHFPLYGSLNQVFARGAPTAQLAERIEATLRIHAQPHRLPTFLDNHDVDRFLAGGDETGLKQGLLALMTLPGIPVIYYGTEQGFRLQRAAMFAAGYGSGGRDHFDREHALYRYIAAATALRRAHPVLSRGTPQLLASNEEGPGAIVWTMDGGGTATRGERLLVAFNTAPHAVLADNLALPAGSALAPLFALEGSAPALQADAQGRLHLSLPARSGFVWRLQAPGAAAPQAGGNAGDGGPRIDALAQDRFEGDFALSGQASPGQALQLVVDGRLEQAQALQADAQGRWQARVDTSAMIDPRLRHRLVVLAEGRATPPLAFSVQRPWQLVADVADPAGDDHGPARPDGTPRAYRYPSDAGWQERHLADLRRTRLYTAGGALRIELGLPEISQGWNPPNGFDRVALTVFIELPGQAAGSGSQVLPLQRARLPDGMRWHRRLRINGWSNALHSWEGASAEHEGQPQSPAAHIEVLKDEGTLRLSLPAASLGQLRSLSGARVYVTTWDYDAGFRALEREPKGYAFGGASSDADPLVMDDTAVITIP